MSERPLAVTIYCGLISILLIVALFQTTVPYLASYQGPLLNVAIGFVPLALLLIFLWGVWRVRWWGVIGLSLTMFVVLALTIAVIPDSMNVRSMASCALVLLPLWLVA